MRTSLELVVIVIVLLITAIVVLGIFTGGIQNFMNIFGTTSDEQIKNSLCASACANYCFLHPETSSEGVDWGSGGVPLPKYKNSDVSDCLTRYGGKCKCNK